MHITQELIPFAIWLPDLTGGLRWRASASHDFFFQLNCQYNMLCIG